MKLAAYLATSICKNNPKKWLTPHLKKVSYVGQFGILAGMTGGGFILGLIASFILLLGKMDIGTMQGADAMASLFVPENANILRVVQLVSTFLIFFLPAVVYAKICHKKAFTHLGYRRSVSLPQLILVFFIMLACLPLVGVLSELIERLPFSEASLSKFKKAEVEYMKQVEVIGRMNNTGDFILSLFMLAVFPAIFEETLFRGGLQNLLSRWWKAPVIAIIVTSLVFSFIHLSYIGFLSRAVLGFILGWMYHRTGNLWLPIFAHITNNAVALTALYVMKLKDPKKDISDGPEFQIWMALISLVVVIGLFFLFDKVSKHQIDKPGQEVPLENVSDDPFTLAHSK